MSAYRVISCIVGRRCLPWPMRSLDKTINLCPASFCTPRPHLSVFQISLDFLLFHSSPLWWKGHLFLVLVLEGLVVFRELFNFSFFGISGWSIDLDYCDAKWFAAAAAKSFQLCPTLCDPLDGSPPGSPVPGILQARTLEWVAISFSSWMVCLGNKSRSFYCFWDCIQVLHLGLLWTVRATPFLLRDSYPR